MAIEFRKSGEILKSAKSETKKQEAPAKTKAILDALEKEAEMSKGKRQVSIRFDVEVLEYFEGFGMGWRTRLNQLCLDYVRRKKAQANPD